MPDRDKDSGKEKDTPGKDREKAWSPEKDKDKDKDKDKAGAAAKVYRYSTELTQMCFVFGVKDVSEGVVQYLEDILRSQLAELLAAARAQAARRCARQVAVEDLLFLTRHDRAKLNRLRTYLSWKDVRRKLSLKESQTEDADDGGMDLTEEPTNDKVLKMQKMTIPIVWDIEHIYSEYLSFDSDGDELDDTDEAFPDEVNEEAQKQLKEADDLTAAMNAAQYAYYSECRQATFTYRKGKKFRDFANLNAALEGNPSDEVLDVLSFLAYEMVRTICDAGKSVKEARANAALAASAAAAAADAAAAASSANAKGREKVKRRVATTDKDDEMDGTGTPPPADGDLPPPSKKARKGDSPRSPPRVLVDPVSLFSEPVEEAVPSRAATPSGKPSAELDGTGGGLPKEIPPEASLDLEEIVGGFLASQRNAATLKASGMRNWRTGGKRMKVGFI